MSQHHLSKGVRYTRKHGEKLSLAIANLARALEEFCEQEPGEVRSYPFNPSAAEREAVRGLIAKGKADKSWNALIDVDKLESRNTHWVRVKMSSSAEFVGRFSRPDSPDRGFQGSFEHLEIREQHS